MKGSVRVTVSTKKLRYELNLRRNITILQGDSAAFGADMQMLYFSIISQTFDRPRSWAAISSLSDLSRPSCSVILFLFVFAIS
ncbi:MAG: hypothetical protein HFG92_14950 [Dorea sp.]|nr:hypothetical protein [Dorea sp.]